MNTLKKLTAVIVATSILAGCSATKGWLAKRDNGSLDYQKSELLTPIQLPATQPTQPFTKLYPTIDLGDSFVNMTNDSGKQYKLPAPPRN